LRVQSNGNVGIGTITPGGGTTAGTSVLSIKNGIAPVGGVADQVSLFSQDVTNSAELFALDEAGNTTQLSPHNFTLFEPNPSYIYPWSYYSKNDYLGVEISVDMYGAIAEIEKLSGKKFIYTKSIPKVSWSEGQEMQRKARQDEIDRLTARVNELEAIIAKLTDEKEKEDRIREKGEIVIPKPYIKKEPPKWMKDRGVL